MSHVAISKFRKHLPKYLQAVAAGDVVTLTVRGQAVAELRRPATQTKSVAQTLERLRTRAVVADVVSPTGAVWAAAADSDDSA
jgi:antitoxin (DNA-binding transcriptional repressor) of toxin-antitoxin stability system